MAHTIKGGVSFPAGEEPSQNFKDWVFANGIKTPFNPKTTTFEKAPDWVKMRDEKGVVVAPKVDATIATELPSEDIIK